MSEYVNQMNIGISDMVRLEFNEVVNNRTEEVVCLSMNFDFFAHMVDTLQQVVTDRKQFLAEAKRRETDKTLS